MAIDAYALCPGGTGKKIKFCCPDLIPELEKLDRMVEGEQYLAALQHIERLEQTQHRACLFATKATLLRETNQFEAAQSNAAEFLQRFPENPIAWAESAMLVAANEGGRAGMPRLQRAIALSDQPMLSRVYDAMGLVAEALVAEGDWFAGRALWHLQMVMAPDDEYPMQQLMRLNRSAELPLLLKGEPSMTAPPQGEPWQGRFDEAVAPLARARWQECADKLTELARDIPDAPVIWQNLAIVRSWLADDEGAGDAWRKYASLHRGVDSQPAGQVPLENAVEAEALAMMLAKDPLGDATDLVRQNWTVQDPERLQEALLSDRRVVQVPFDPAALATEDSPPPRFVGMLLSRPQPETADGLTLATMPRMLGQVMLYGKQTDREARLEVLGMSAADSGPVKDLLREVGGDALGPQPQEEVTAQTSGSHQLLVQKWYPPRGASREQMDALTVGFQREALLEKWPQLPLGVLGGKSPHEAAADRANHVRLLAAILLLEHWTERSPVEFDFNELRGRLGLPVLGPIDPGQVQVDSVPLVRLSRLIGEKLSDDELLLAFRRAMLFSATEALRKFARAIVDRPTFADRPERFQAYSVLAQTAENSEQALAHVAEGRSAALAAGRSCASWDLLELSFLFVRGDARAAMQLVQHIQQRHIQERGVAQALTQMLVEVGILRPDGTPAVPTTRQEAAAAAMQMQEPAAEPGRLWTPGSEPPPPVGGGGKLWTPG
jgi:hypothetical protein